MVDKLSVFAYEVTKISREVGTAGELGGQAIVEGVSGIWRELTTDVNVLAANLTTQVRAIAEVTKAVALGDLSKKITVPASGEIADLKQTINTMVDQLRTFAEEVTRCVQSESDARLNPTASRSKSAPAASSAARLACPASPARGRR